MTTGTKTVGSEFGPYYSYRSWSGSNGKTAGVGSRQTVFYRLVPILPRKFSIKTITRSNGRSPIYRKVYEALAYQYISTIRVTYDSPQGPVRWNAYVVTGKTLKQVKGSGQYGGYIGVPNGGFDEDFLGWNSNDELKLLSKLSSTVKGHSFNMGVALGEGRQTVELVVHSLGRIARAVSAVKRGRLDLALRQLGAVPRGRHGNRVAPRRNLTHTDISSMWLEIQYGWTPLLSDVYESVKAYHALTGPARTSLVSVTHQGNPRTYKYYSAAHNDVTTYVTSVKLYYEMTEQLTAARSLALCDPTSVAWELVPFSFVADWFIPIGTYLDALATIPHLNGRFLRDVRKTNYCHATGGTGGAMFSFNGAKSAGTMKKLTRSTPSGIAVPKPQFKSIEQALSLPHLRNAFALLHTAVKF